VPKMSAFLQLADIAPSPMTRPRELKSNLAFINAEALVTVEIGTKQNRARKLTCQRA